ncbi:MAG: L-glutamate gamma-semialdehyde dehydrogenase [Bacteroidales bacterium]|nr:L-glutamate gamma-semialdehyde dehydrogenase [Bacteroidales bacterium]MDT8373586.1 L-glutamate gamma-semialdehyde dehydrogenase [Bacteroidales bacterium]
MNNAIYAIQKPDNEPLLTYAAGTTERAALEEELKRISSETVEIPLIINGKPVKTGQTGKVVMPHDHGHVLATYHLAGKKEAEEAVEAAMRAKEAWLTLSWIERASIMLKAAELLSKKYRYTIVAATMLGQSKTVHQAEVEAACETIDFLRFNAYFAGQIYGEQPFSNIDQLNRVEYRPVEGFIYTISPFNFTAIASNLNMSVALMGNTTVWKPATASLLSSWILMKVFMEAGLPAGVINFLPGQGSLISSVVMNHPDLGGIHFTGSNGTFNTLWKTAAANLEKYRSYPRIVGETGGKDFIMIHNSANPLEAATAIIRGSFEFQGQKCSASSRVYIPRSLWPGISEHVKQQASEIKVGDPADFSTFMNAVIDEKSFDNIMRYIELAKASSACEIVHGGNGDKNKGYFIEPTIILTSDPDFITMKEEIFGPVVTLYIYDDDRYEETLHLCNETSPYGLTGSIFSTDRSAMVRACQVLRFAAGNFYLNDKPTGAMVGLQPFGGARASGTNDKAGGRLNLVRWTSPRTIKETFLPATEFRYPYMD